MGIDLQVETKVTRAKIALLKKHCFYGTLACRLIFVQDDNLNPPSMAVDGVSVFYHPSFVLENSNDDLQFVIAHEVMHVVLDHIVRLLGRDPEEWNIAGDFAINPILIECGLRIPKGGGLYNPDYVGMTADAIYALRQQQKQQSASPPLTSFDSLRPAPPGPGGKPKSGTELREMQDEWKMAVAQAAAAAKGVGQLPGALERFVEMILSDAVDWRLRLRHFATEVTRNDYSWQRLNRRYASMGIFLPGLYSESMGTLVVVTDDSGSIGNKVLQAFAGEIASIRDAVTPERTLVISCDRRVNHVDDLAADDPFDMQCHGGGGTDFRPPFEWLTEQGVRPACLIYLTDLEGPFPQHAPDYPVLWCSTTKHIAPWGETLYIGDAS